MGTNSDMASSYEFCLSYCIPQSFSYPTFIWLIWFTWSQCFYFMMVYRIDLNNMIIYEGRGRLVITSP